MKLSEKTVSVPSGLRDKPSGTDTVNRFSGEVNVMYTWLSGCRRQGCPQGPRCPVPTTRSFGTVPVVDGPWPQPPATAAAKSPAIRVTRLGRNLMVTSAVHSGTVDFVDNRRVG
ncbi:hypothetical protein QV65_32775 [Rhodococcus erythropolis]|nr:hypothetical protein QV65_32775 [Rhodococcus erythropolis]